MANLQKIVLGTPPLAQDGDTSRGANTKANSNVDVLNAQAALTSAATITVAQALTSAHVGKRVNIILNAAGVINLPAASTCAADNVLLLRNLGTTVATLAVTAGSGDGVALSRLNPGETALMDTDGVHTWSVLMRGRTNSDNETVNGSCTVNGNETVAGTLTTFGAIIAQYATPFYYLNDTSQANGGGRYRMVSSNGSLIVQRNTAADASFSSVTAPLSIGANDVVTLTQRPAWAGVTPYDTGNTVAIANGGTGANTAAAAVQALGAAPKPSAGGVGALLGFIAGAGVPYSLPAGGTWAYLLTPFANPGGTMGTGVGPAAGVAAGGTQVVNGIAGYSWTGFVWKLS